MRLGLMNTRIEIVTVSVTKNKYGEREDEEKTPVASVRACFEPSPFSARQNGSEREVNMAVFSSAAAIFTFRRIPNIEITDKHVILCNGDRYGITSVDNTKGRGMYVEVLAERQMKGSVR